MPDTVNGYFLPRKVSTPCPPPTPTIKPPLVKTTATAPVSAWLGVARPTETKNPSTAASIIPVRYFFITLPSWVRARTTMARLQMQTGLLREEHREVTEHGEQGAGKRRRRPGNRSRHRALDLHGSFATQDQNATAHRRRRPSARP